MLQQTIAEEYLGRVYGLWDAIEAGVLIASFGPRLIIAGAGGIALLCVLVGLLGLVPATRHTALAYDPPTAGE